MKHFFVLFTVMTALFIAAPVAAQAQETRSSAAKPPTRIETDSESHEIRFFIDDELTAVLEADGLHVRGGMSSTGEITVYGSSGFDPFGGNPDTTTKTAEDNSDAK